MYKGKKVFDVHGHISTPPHFRAAAMNLIALRTAAESAAMPEAGGEAGARPASAHARRAQCRCAAHLAAAGGDAALGADLSRRILDRDHQQGDLRPDQDVSRAPGWRRTIAAKPGDEHQGLRQDAGKMRRGISSSSARRSIPIRAAIARRRAWTTRRGSRFMRRPRRCRRRWSCIPRSRAIRGSTASRIPISTTT